MIKPFQADDAFLNDVHQARQQADALHLWWLGQSGFLLQWQGRHLLFDPYLSDSLTHKYANTAKPHIRMTERVIAPEQLDFLDVVTSSHNHTDHLDAFTLLPIRQVNPAVQLVIPSANRAFVAERLQCDPAWPIGIDAGQSVTLAPFRITALPAAHENLERNERGEYHYLGYVVECGPWTIYHSGDTVLYDDLAERLRGWPIDVALLPINGRDPARGVAGNLSGPEAAQLAHAVGAGLVVPCHYEMFTFNTASPAAFQAACEALGQAYHILQAGERLTLYSPM